MKTFKLINSKTNQIIKIVKAKNVLEIVKKYDLATRKHINTIIEKIET